MMKSNLQYWRKHHGLALSLIFFLLQVISTSIRALGWSAICLVRRGGKAPRGAEAVGYWRMLRWLAVSGMVHAINDPAPAPELLLPGQSRASNMHEHKAKA
jgi:hypothetical protein